MERKTLRVAARNFEPMVNVVSFFWNKFKDECGCALDLEVVSMDLDELVDNLFTKKGLEKGNWDIAHIHSDWMAAEKEKNSFFDIGPCVQKDPPEDYPLGWSEKLLQLQTFGNEIYGFPFHDGPECFIYRKDLFQDPVEKERYKMKYGQELKVPETWEEFTQAARFFNRPEDNLYGTVFAAYPDRHNNVFDFALQLWSRGGELEIENKVTLISPQAEDAMEFYREIVNDKTAVYPKCRETDSLKSGMLFAEGKIAMMVNWFGFASMCETVTSGDIKVKGKIGIDSIPRDKGIDRVSLSVIYTWTIGSGSPFKDIAYKFIKYCVSEENDRLLPLKGVVGCRKSTWKDEKINAVIPYYSELIDMHSYVKQFPKLTIWHDITKIIDELVLEVLNTDKPIRRILDAAQTKVDDLYT
jgi:multiple sugar transport system substrate-binding protein